ncbi:hypothetical protein LCGC14_1438290 [marine sediment metagenome]|uniref:Uncharacterized protein n=1 Tax=marine sediment metagenome TaxID=412755 RepID=A0A0F9K7M3_9ZZZZ
MSNAEVIRILNDLVGNLDLSFKQREALSWAIAKLTK